MEPRIDPVEARNDELHRLVAARIRRDPGAVAEARETLERWIASGGPDPHPVLLEWRAVLMMLEPAELADFLESRLPRARRLRTSSPFAGLAR